MKKLLFLLFGFGVLQPAFAQQAKTDHLLWFKGRLIKPNVLLTPGGDTIYYNPKKSEIKRVSKTGNGRMFDKMLSELNKTPRRVDEAVKEISKSIPPPLQPDMIAAVKQAYTDLEKQWKPLLSNTYALPEGDFSPVPKMINGKGGVHDIIADEEDPLERVLVMIRAFLAKHKNDDLGSLLPVPPRYNFTYCFPCDSMASQRYENEKDRFIEEVMAAENGLYMEALSACRQIQVKYGDELNEPANADLKKRHDEAFAFIDFVLLRAADRAVLLLEKYKLDPYRLTAVFQFVLSIDRRMQILGISDETTLGKMDYWTIVMKTMDDFFLNAFNQKDYTIALNVRTILMHERTNQLLGLGKGAKNLLAELMKFNQFKLSSNITAKVSGNGGYVMGHVRGDNWFYAIPDKETCRLNWTLAATTIDRTAKYKLLAAEVGGAPVEYVGTKDWQSQPPVFKMDFCYKEGEEVPDTIIAATFHPEGFREKWRFPEPTGIIEVEQVSGILMSSFIDVERMKEEAELMNKDKIEQMKKEMQDKYAAKMTGANMNNMQELAQKAQADMEKMNREIKEMLAKANPLKYVFTPQVNNKTKDILKERLDGREIFPENPAIEYAWFHLTLEHDPDGPHPINIYLFGNLVNR